MNNTLFVFGFLCCCLFQQTIAAVNKTACSVENNEHMDLIVARLVAVGEHGRRYPENNKQLRPFCNTSLSLANQFDQYKNRCFKGHLKQFSSLFIYSVRNSVRKFCVRKSRRLNEIFKAANCVNRHSKQVNQCMRKLTNSLIGIKYAPDGKKIPMVCCEYVHLIECMTGVFERSKSCNNRVETIVGYLRELMGDVMDASCGDYSEDNDKCSQLERPPKVKSADKPVKSILFPLYDVFNSLPE